MIQGVFQLSSNIYLEPERLRALGGAGCDEHARIDALQNTSETRRGMRHGMLRGHLSATCLSHAIALPYDLLVGTGPARLPQTWAYHGTPGAQADIDAQADTELESDSASSADTDIAENDAPLPLDAYLTYGAPTGALGPVFAAVVGFLAGTSKTLGMGLGLASGLITSPTLLWQGGHSANFKARLHHHRGVGGNQGLRLGHAAAALGAAAVSDALRLPSVAIKALLPIVGMGIGACIGSALGLKQQWPGGLSACVQSAGQNACEMSQQGIIIALEVLFLYVSYQARIGT